MISVIIPTYNRSSCICEAIDSVLAQSYTDIEVIVVDDCSTDDTVLKITERYKIGEEVRLLSLDKNCGVGAARNIGVELAKGEYIAFQDSDDLFLPKKLEEQMELMLAENSEMCFCKFKNPELTVPEFEGKFCLMQPDLYYWLLLAPFIGAPTMLMNKRCFKSIGGFDSEVRAQEDYEFSIRFAKKYKISFVDKILLHVRRFDEGVNSDYFNIFRVSVKIFKDNYSYIKQKNIDKYWIDLLRDMAKKCNSQEAIEEFRDVRKWMKHSELIVSFT